jgi:serine/threonine protein phosphatase PrpC
VGSSDLIEKAGSRIESGNADVSLGPVENPAEALRRISDVLAGTRHPCLPSSYLVGRHPSLPVDLLFVEYDPSSDWLLSLTTSPGDVCRIGGQLAQLLSACHTSGVAIVSLRPEAVRWSRASGRATVLRFEGVSPLQSPTQPRSWGVATAPEILLGDLITTAADVYSLGVLLASCLGMLRSEPGDEPNVLDGSSARGHVDLSALVMRCASPRPMDRPGLQHVARELGRLRGAFNAVLAVDTTIGRVRDVQEDSWAALTLSGAAPDSSVTVAAIADGMGGAEAGEVASRLAVRTFLSSISAKLGALGEDRLDGPTIDDALTAAFAEASSRIQGYAREHPERRDLGTTLTGAVIAGGAVRVGHAGDTRCTLVRDGTVAQLTTDHTVVARLVEIGEIDETEALSHPQRSTLYRSLGGDRPTAPELSSFDLLDGDWLILTTDGVHGLVSGRSVVDATSSSTPAQVARALVNEALAAGGHDNATAICINVLAAAPQE